MIDKFLDTEAKALYLLHRDGLQLAALHALRSDQDIGDREDTDQGGQGVEASHQVGKTKGKSSSAVDRSHTDQGEHQSEQAG